MKLTDFDIVKKNTGYFERMSETPQDPIHHQEGDVYTHTEMVLNALINLPEFQELPENEQQLLIYTALFHDVCKPHTFQKDANGRISHPRHARKGADLTRQLLDESGYAFDFWQKVYYLIFFHGYPFRIFDKSNPLKDAIRMSLLADNKLLYIFAKADLLGRICDDHDGMLYNLELFKVLCEENNIFGKPKVFASDYDRFYYFHKDDSYPDTELFHEYDFEIYLMCGLPASGKDSYLKKHLTSLPQIHLDAIREELDIKPTDNQGIIIQESRERSKELCRKKQSFVWNATNITTQVRATLIDIWLPYNPKINIVFLHKPFLQLLKDNASRDGNARLPDGKLHNMFQRLEIPSLIECHTLEILLPETEKSWK
jgi:putative nucleotidyltransferase with HDIG domain